MLRWICLADKDAFECRSQNEDARVRILSIRDLNRAFALSSLAGNALFQPCSLSCRNSWTQSRTPWDSPSTGFCGVSIGLKSVGNAFTKCAIMLVFWEKSEGYSELSD